jgi:cell division septation protein DedD
MPERKQPKPARASGGSRGRARFAARDQGGRFSRPLLAALIVILAGGAYLFWPRGGSPPSGIGEQLTVVTADSSIVPAPRSGSVEIDDQQMPLVPEKPATDAAGESGQPAPEPEVVAPVEQKPATTSPPPSRPAPARSQTDAPAKPAIKPHPSGAWAVQIGAYQTEANAQGLVDRLASKDIVAHVRAANTATGDIIYRVWIGWFKNRQEALDYAAQERRRIGEAYPVHR